MLLNLNKNDCYCDIVQFYKNLANKMGVVMEDDTCFDCTKVCITKDVNALLYDYYEIEEGRNSYDVTVLFALVGPKASLKEAGLLAKIEHGFVTKEGGASDD